MDPFWKTCCSSHTTQYSFNVGILCSAYFHVKSFQVNLFTILSCYMRPRRMLANQTRGQSPPAPAKLCLRLPLRWKSTGGVRGILGLPVGVS